MDRNSMNCINSDRTFEWQQQLKTGQQDSGCVELSAPSLPVASSRTLFCARGDKLLTRESICTRSAYAISESGTRLLLAALDIILPPNKLSVRTVGCVACQRFTKKSRRLAKSSVTCDF
eukprot:COSAG02_NODE_1630_length_11576_cov_21.066045_2_plen_119_part_00